VAPLRLGGLRGKQSTPSDWLGGTGEGSTVGEAGSGTGAREYSDFVSEKNIYKRMAVIVTEVGSGNFILACRGLLSVWAYS
jgi:hypothetical protein